MDDTRSVTLVSSFVLFWSGTEMSNLDRRSLRGDTFTVKKIITVLKCRLGVGLLLTLNLGSRNTCVSVNFLPRMKTLKSVTWDHSPTLFRPSPPTSGPNFSYQVFNLTPLPFSRSDFETPSLYCISLHKTILLKVVFLLTWLCPSLFDFQDVPRMWLGWNSWTPNNQNKNEYGL